MTEGRGFLRALTQRTALVSLSTTLALSAFFWIVVVTRATPAQSLTALFSAETIAAVGTLVASLLAYQLAVLLASRSFLVAACGLFAAGSLWFAGLVTRPLPEAMLAGARQGDLSLYLIVGGLGLLPLAVWTAGRTREVDARSVAAAFGIAATLTVAIGILTVVNSAALPPLLADDGFTFNSRLVWSTGTLLIATAGFIAHRQGVLLSPDLVAFAPGALVAGLAGHVAVLGASGLTDPLWAAGRSLTVFAFLSLLAGLLRALLGRLGEQIRLREATRSEAARFLGLNRIVTSAHQAADDTEFAALIDESLREALGVVSVTIYRLTADGRRLRLTGATLPQVPHPVEFALDLPYAGIRSFVERKVVVLSLEEVRQNIARLGVGFVPPGMEWVAGLPLEQADACRGSVAVAWGRGSSRDSIPAGFLEVMARSLSLADYTAELSRRAGELERLDQAKDEFLLAISHDLKTPITALIGYSDVVTDGTGRLTEQQRQEALQALRVEGDRLRDVIANLLDVSQLDLPDHPRPEPVLVREVVGEVTRGLAPVLPGDRIRVESTTTRTALADRHQLARIVVNLVTNADKYAGPESIIRIRIADGPGGTVDMHVDDDGPGIAPAVKNRLFSKFARYSSDPGIPGTGLGLYIVRRLAEGVRAAVSAGTSPEGGARFTVRFQGATSITSQSELPGFERR